MIRADNADQVYKTEREKFNAIVDEIIDKNKRGSLLWSGLFLLKIREAGRPFKEKRDQAHGTECQVS